MAEEYTPSLEDARTHYANSRVDRGPISLEGRTTRQVAEAEFDQIMDAEKIRARIEFADELTRKGVYSFDIHSIRKYAKEVPNGNV